MLTQNTCMSAVDEHLKLAQQHNMWILDVAVISVSGVYSINNGGRVLGY